MKNACVGQFRAEGPRRSLSRLAKAVTAAAATLSGLQAAPVVSAELEEVLVTATRRAETDVQTTAVSVSALNSQSLSELVPRDLGDIAISVPNFSSGKQPGFRSAAFSIRGVGITSIIVYQDSQVGVTVDDFVLPSLQTQNLEMFDIQQIEVLRGPQGTLFGKNTTGGVINVKTKRPELERNTLEVQGKVEEYGRYEGRFAGNLAVGDTWAFRAAGGYIQSDGYYENNAEWGPVTGFDPAHPAQGQSGRGNGDDIGGDDVFSGRFKALWQPNDNFTALAQYEIIRDNGDTPPSVNTTPAGAPFTFNALNLGAFSGGDAIENAGVTNRDDLLLEMSDGHQVDVDGYYLNLDWTLGDYTLSSVTGYREQESQLPSTYTGKTGPVSLFDANRVDERETLQQELRLASDFTGPFNFVAGGFYQQDDTEFCVVQVLGFLDLVGLGSQIFGDPTYWDNNPQVLCNKQDASSWAVFADFDYELSDRWAFGAGIRYTNEEKEWTGRNQVFFPQLDPSLTWEDFSSPLGAADFGRFSEGVLSDEESWNEPTWRATLSYTISDDMFSYLTYSRGFKSGAYNDQSGTSGAPLTPRSVAPTDPETADSFELGLKSDLWDNRLRLNLSAFYVEYSDAQRDLVASFQNPFGGTFQETRFFNAADMTAQGLEAEFVAALTDNFTLRGSMGYLDADYDEFTADTDFDGVDDVDLSDAEVNRAPELQWNLDAIYEHGFLGGNLRWLANVNYEDDSIYTYAVLGPQYDGMTDDRTLLNANVTYTEAAGRYWVRLYGKNLTDEEYRVGELPVADLWTFAYFGEPRVFGIEAGIFFGN